MSSGRNYELQQIYLTAAQQRISANLFELGVVSRLLYGAKADAGAALPTGLDQLDRVFVPSLHARRTGDTPERELSLTGIAAQANGSRNYSIRVLGTLDQAYILSPYPGIDPADAEMVNEAAQELVAARDTGILPDLGASLVRINDPHTLMIALDR
jgi:hypothetical protein